MSLKKPKILKYIKVAPSIPLFLSVLKIEKLSCKPYFWGADYEFGTHLNKFLHILRNIVITLHFNKTHLLTLINPFCMGLKWNVI